MDLENKRQLLDLEGIQRDYDHEHYTQTLLNRAYAMMLCKQGQISKEEYTAIDDGLVKVYETLKREDLDANKTDLFFNHEDLLYKIIGMDTACKLHVGRSRNDVYFTLYRMQVRESIWILESELEELMKLLEEKIEENKSVILPYYTYGQPAQPGTYGHYLLSIYQAFEADLKRLKSAYETVNKCPMGAAASIGTAFNLDKYMLRDLLGFDETIENTLMANSAVDYYIETINVMTIMGTTFSRLVNDLLYFAELDVSILDADRSICGGSSIMPQKKNLGYAADIRAKVNMFNGYAFGAINNGAAATLFPVHDTFSYLVQYWDNFKLVVDNIRMIRLLIERVHIRQDIALVKARDGFTAATNLAEQLTMKIGQPFVKTHHIVAGMIHELMDDGRLTVSNMTAELLNKYADQIFGIQIDISDEEIQLMLDPLESLNAKVTGGTPKPEDTMKMLKEDSAKVKELQDFFKMSKAKVEAAYKRIENRNF